MMMNHLAQTVPHPLGAFAELHSLKRPQRDQFRAGCWWSITDITCVDHDALISSLGTRSIATRGESASGFAARCAECTAGCSGRSPSHQAFSKLSTVLTGLTGDCQLQKAQKGEEVDCFRTNPAKSDSCTTATIVTLDLNRKLVPTADQDGMLTASPDNFVRIWIVLG